MNPEIKINKCPTSSAAYYILVVLLTVQMSIGSFLIIICEICKLSILKYFHEIQKNELNIRMYLIEFYALQLIVIYLCGIGFAKKSLSEPYTNHLKILLKFWNTLIFLVSLEGIVTAWLCQESFDSVAQSIEISLYRGIDSYYENSNWRLIWDNLQYHNQCCGVKDYHDWEAITWIEYEMKTKQDAALTNLEYVALTPYSCCKIASSCYENLFAANSGDERSKRMQLHQLLDTNESIINKKGCLNDLLKRMTIILNLTVHLALVVFFIQFLVSALMAFIFVTNRTYKGVNYDVESECSDFDDEMAVSRLVAQNEDVRKQYCGEYDVEPEAHRRRSRSPGPNNCYEAQYLQFNLDDQELWDAQRFRHRSQENRRNNNGQHRRSSSLDPSSEHRRKSFDDEYQPNNLNSEADFRRSILEPAEQFCRRVHSYEQRHGNIYRNEPRNEESRRNSLRSDDETRRNSLNQDDEPRRRSITPVRRSNVDEYRHSIIDPADEIRRSVAGTNGQNGTAAEQEPRRSSLSSKNR